MSAQAEKRTLIAVGGLLVVLASRVFYFQEMFFALLLFAGVFFGLLLLACIIAGVWMFYEKAVISLARWTAKQGYRGLLALRAKLLELAPNSFSIFITCCFAAGSFPPRDPRCFTPSAAHCAAGCGRSFWMPRTSALTPNAPSSICGFC